MGTEADRRLDAEREAAWDAISDHHLPDLLYEILFDDDSNAVLSKLWEAMGWNTVLHSAVAEVFANEILALHDDWLQQARDDSAFHE